ncbi:MAG: hypothetical protein AB7K09_25850 [Planctomycetota bacterium]
MSDDLARTLRQLGLLLDGSLGLTRAISLVLGDTAARPLRDGTAVAPTDVIDAPPMIRELLRVAVENGTTPEVLGRVADGLDSGVAAGDGLRAFTFVLGEFVAAGSTFGRAFAAMATADGQLSPAMRALADDAARACEDGGAICDTMDRHPAVVPEWYRAVFREFEVAGRSSEATFRVLLAGLDDRAFGGA